MINTYMWNDCMNKIKHYVDDYTVLGEEVIEGQVAKI